jgi:hypothetical protein
MKHFYRTHLTPVDALALGDTFFATLGMKQSAGGARTRTFSGPLGTMKMHVGSEGGHYTMVVVETDQMGESRLDRNVKRFFVDLHRKADSGHKLEAAY